MPRRKLSTVHDRLEVCRLADAVYRHQVVCEVANGDAPAPLTPYQPFTIISEMPHCALHVTKWRPHELLLTFRGTSNTSDLTMVMLTRPHLLDGGDSSVHLGVWLLASTFFSRPEVRQIFDDALFMGMDIVLVGHSLGGAVAMAVASLLMDMAPTKRTNLSVVTFGMMPFIYQNGRRWHRVSPLALDIHSRHDLTTNSDGLCRMAMALNRTVTMLQQRRQLQQQQQQQQTDQTPHVLRCGRPLIIDDQPPEPGVFDDNTMLMVFAVQQHLMGTYRHYWHVEAEKDFDDWVSLVKREQQD